MEKHFSELFSVREGQVIPKCTIQIEDKLIPPGVILKGLDLSEYIGKYLYVEVTDGVYHLKGYFKLYLFNKNR